MLRKYLRIGLTLLLFVTLLTSFVMLADVLEDSSRFEHLYSTLLMVSSVGLFIIGILIILNLHDLIQQIRRKRSGAFLTARLIVLFIALSITPVLVVFYFSLGFINQRLENWFDTQIEQSLSSALQLSRAALDSNLREALNKTRKMATQLSSLEDELIASELNAQRQQSNASELLVFAPTRGEIIAVSSDDTGKLLPKRPEKNLKLRHRDDQVSLQPLTEHGLFVQAIVRYQTSARPDPTERYLVAWFAISSEISMLANDVEQKANNYQRLAYLRTSLKSSFSLVLSLIMLLTVLSAIWAAFVAARQLVRPIRNLVEGTKAVAAGDYDKQLPISHLDELGFLVESFNQMTRKIREARNAAHRSQHRADAQLTYLEMVLARMSSGVLSLDSELCLRMSNDAAENILGVSLADLKGKSLLESCVSYPPLQTLCEGVATHLKAETVDWQEQLAFFGTGGRKVLLCRGAKLPDLDGQGIGHLIVFDDITQLLQAQRDAAWSEVARRLAHEIKNPLTPIRLSAERLKHKYLADFSEKDAQTFERMTHTIIQQVDAMKEMVDAFSEYARTPQMVIKPLALDKLVNEVLDLYPSKSIQRQLEPVQIEADAGRLRQVLHNVLKNALESNVNDPKIIVSIVSHQENESRFVELKIQDNGHGVSEEVLGRIFEPYVTTKTKGTGLGLAIVKKIIEEHGGMIWMENNPDGGASVIIKLPELN
jgi:PAS domain S-box-containing protein